jgi:hypothetical protein
MKIMNIFPDVASTSPGFLMGSALLIFLDFVVVCVSVLYIVFIIFIIYVR